MAQRQLENYEKKPKSIKEQIALLKSRNLLFENEFRAEVILKNISYNRLSNYWYPLLKEPKEDEIFKAGSPFISAFRLYQFDSEFRKITFHAIEQIEIAVRTQIIYQLSHKYGTGFWFEKHEAFNHYSNYLKVLNKIASRCDETNQEYILKYKLKYKQYNPPAWKSFELLTFNELLLILKAFQISRI